MLSLLLASVVAAPAPAVPLPKGAQPRLLSLAVKNGNLVAEVTVQQIVPVTRTEVVNVNGMNVTRTVTSYETIMKKVTQTWPLKGANASYADGKKIDAK